MRLCHAHQNIHPNHVFQPIVSAPTIEDRKPRVDWTEFHTVLPVGSHDSNHSGQLQELTSLWRTSSECACCGCWACLEHNVPKQLSVHAVPAGLVLSTMSPSMCIMTTCQGRRLRVALHIYESYVPTLLHIILYFDTYRTATWLRQGMCRCSAAHVTVHVASSRSGVCSIQ